MHDKRLQSTHLGMEEADRAALRVVRAERIRTDQFGQLRSFVDRRRAHWAHFVQDDPNTSARQLPSSLGASKSTPDDVNRPHSIRHFGKLGCWPPGDNLMGINQRPNCSYEDTDDPAKSGVS
jgi:hypothetical protein